jgi:hypothetical protein
MRSPEQAASIIAAAIASGINNAVRVIRFPFYITPARRFKVMMTKVSAQQVTSGGNY